MATVLNGEAQRGVDLGPRPVALDGEFGERGGDVERGERGADLAQGLAGGDGAGFQRVEDFEFELEGAIGGGRDAGLQVDQRVGGEAHRALHGLAVDEGGVLEQSLAGRLRRLDVEAEEIVVLDA